MEKTGTNPRVPFVVKADPLLQPLIPDYLKNRRADADRLAELLARRDFETLRRIGHNMSGSGAAYGLAPLSDLGKQIEDAALAGDVPQLDMLVGSLREFLDTVKLPP